MNVYKRGATIFLLAILTVTLTTCSSGSGNQSVPATTADGPVSAITVPAASQPATDPSSASDPVPNQSAVQPEGFSTVSVRITEADGDVCDVCVWLADTADERGRGLMGVEQLGDAAGMAFVFEQPFLGAFYMFQTPTPLSIAWFDTDGAWVGSSDMQPCLDRAADDCERYQPDQPYDLAIEVFAGGLEALGLGRGAVVELLAGSEGLECQTPQS